MVTVAPLPCGTGEAGEKDSLTDAHGEVRVYGTEALVSKAAVPLESRTQTPKYSVPAGAPFEFHW